jgi:hypothetical protein
MKKILAIILSLIITSSVFAGHHGDPNVAEIKEVYRSYVDHFIKKDYQGIPKHFQTPLVQRMAQGTMVSEDAAAISRTYKNYMDNIQNGYKYSKIDRLDVTSITESLYYADVDISRYNGKDEVLYQGRSIYFFSNTDGAWKMFAMEQVKSK